MFGSFSVVMKEVAKDNGKSGLSLVCAKATVPSYEHCIVYI